MKRILTGGIIGLLLASGPRAAGGGSGWEAFDLARLEQQRDKSGRPYLSFLDVGSLSSGLYELAAGAEDAQVPHERDEIYYVIRGRATLRVAGDSVAVKAGSIVYIERGVEHRFVDIEEDLSVLVVFAGGDDD